MTKPIDIFYCYAREDGELQKDLVKHLSPLERSHHMIGWSDQDIQPGTPWEQEIAKHIDNANLIFLLISHNFLHSENCMREMEKALQKHRNGDVHVVPVILSPCLWQLSPIAELQVMPKDGKPITQWSNTNEAFLDVVQGITKILLAEGALLPEEANILEPREQPTATSSVRGIPDGTSREDWDSSRLLKQVWSRLEREREGALAGRVALPLKLCDSSGLPVNLSPARFLDKMANELLILGEPGSGKTLLLTDLALELCARASQRPSDPVPVVLNLASWAKRRQPLATWVLKELTSKPFEIPRKLCQEWMRSHQILLLLDGLDEVHPAYREACILAINVYRKNNGVVVCCRSSDYQGQITQLQLHGTVIVQPLEERQVDRYLSNVGRPLLTVREALRHDSLREVVTTPLMLRVLIEACQGMTVADMQALDVSELRRKLLENYVQRKLELPHAETPYPAEESRETLSWLAWQMTDHHQEVFFTNQIQPDWLATPQSWWPVLAKGLKWLIGLDCGLLGGWLSGLFFGWCLWKVPLSGLDIGFVGVLLAVGLGVPFSLSIDAQYEELQTPPRARGPRRLLSSSLFGYLLAYVSTFFDLSGIPVFGWTSGFWPITGVMTLFMSYIFPVSLVMLPLPLFAFTSSDNTRPAPVPWREIQDIRPLAVPGGGLWRTARPLMSLCLSGGVFGIMVGFFAGGPFLGAHYSLPYSLIVDWLIGGFFCGILVTLLAIPGFLLIRGWFGFAINKDHLTAWTTKQDIWRSAGQGMLVGCTYGFVVGLVAGLMVGFGPDLLNHFGIPTGNLLRIQIQMMRLAGTYTSGQPAEWIALFWPFEGLFFLGIPCALFLGLLFGGVRCMKHLILRGLMACMATSHPQFGKKSAYWGYLRYAYIRQSRHTEFLNEAVRRGLLRKAGGGYCFIHPLLQQFFSEHFVAMATANAAMGQGVSVWRWFRESMKSALKQMEPALKRLEPVLKRLEPALKQVKPALKRLEPTLKQMEPTLKRLEPALKQVTRRRVVIAGLGITGLAIAGDDLLWLLLSPRPLYTYHGHADAVNAVAWSPDGTRIASGSNDGTVQMWNAADGSLVLTYPSPDQVITIAWSPNGHYIAYITWNMTEKMLISDVIEGYPNYFIQATSVTALAWSPDSTHIAWGAVVETPEGASQAAMQVGDFFGSNPYTYYYEGDEKFGYRVNVLAVAWSPDGKFIASGWSDGTVQVVNASDGAHIFTYHGHATQQVVSAVAWSPDGTRIASGSDDRTVQVWNAANGGHVLTYHGHADAVNAVAWSPDGTRIASGSDDQTVQVWNGNRGDQVFTYRGHADFYFGHLTRGPVTAVAWSPNGKRIASSSQDRTVQVWEVS